LKQTLYDSLTIRDLREEKGDKETVALLLASRHTWHSASGRDATITLVLFPCLVFVKAGELFFFEEDCVCSRLW